MKLTLNIFDYKEEIIIDEQEEKELQEIGYDTGELELRFVMCMVSSDKKYNIKSPWTGKEYEVRYSQLGDMVRKEIFMIRNSVGILAHLGMILSDESEITFSHARQHMEEKIKVNKFDEELPRYEYIMMMGLLHEDHLQRKYEEEPTPWNKMNIDEFRKAVIGFYCKECDEYTKNSKLSEIYESIDIKKLAERKKSYLGRFKTIDDYFEERKL